MLCRRTQTRTDHLREVLAYTGWRTIDAAGWKDLDEFLFARAMEHDRPKVLFRLACEYLLSSRVVRPGVVHLLEPAAVKGELEKLTYLRRLDAHTLDLSMLPAVCPSMVIDTPA